LLLTPDNQKYCLLKALIQENDFVHFEETWRRLGPFIDLHAHLPLLETLLEFFEWFLEKAYRFLSPSVISLKKPKIPLIPSRDDASTFITHPLEDLELNPPDCDYQNMFCSLENARKYLEFMKQMARIFEILKTDIGVSPLAYGKLCRVFK
jgi:hypothetical protein